MVDETVYKLERLRPTGFTGHGNIKMVSPQEMYALG